MGLERVLHSAMHQDFHNLIKAFDVGASNHVALACKEEVWLSRNGLQLQLQQQQQRYQQAFRGGTDFDFTQL